MNETRKGEWTRAQIGRLGTGASPQFTRLEGQGSRAPNLVRSLCGVALPRAWKGDVVPDTTHSALGHTAPTRAPSSTGRLGGRPAARGAQQPGAPSSEGRPAARGAQQRGAQSQPQFSRTSSGRLAAVALRLCRRLHAGCRGPDEDRETGAQGTWGPRLPYSRRARLSAPGKTLWLRLYIFKKKKKERGTPLLSAVPRISKGKETPVSCRQSSEEDRVGPSLI